MSEDGVKVLPGAEEAPPAPPPLELQTPCRSVVLSPAALSLTPATQPPSPLTPVAVGQSPGALVMSPGSSAELCQAPELTVMEGALLQCINCYLKHEDNQQVCDLRTDLRNGVLLGKLVSMWTGQCLALPHASLPITQAKAILNVQECLDALAKDGFSLDSNDQADHVVQGNFSYVIELIKRLILHYHFTFGHNSSSVPSLDSQLDHKKCLMLWLKAVLPDRCPDLSVASWADGGLLASLLLHCKPELDRELEDKRDLSEVMEVATTHFGIPPLLETIDFSSSSTDSDFILMAYLFFFARAGSPSQAKLLKWVNNILLHSTTNTARDFGIDWEDGRMLYQVVQALTPNSVPKMESLAKTTSTELITLALDAAHRNMCIPKDFTATEIGAVSDPFPLVLFLARLHSLKDTPRASHPSSKLFIRADIKKLQRVGSTMSIEVDGQDSLDYNLEATVHEDTTANIGETIHSSVGQDGSSHFEYTPNRVGHFSMSIKCKGIDIPDTPLYFKTFDPRKCRLVKSLDGSYLTGELVVFDVTTTDAGQGTITAQLSHGTPPDKVIFSDGAAHTSTVATSSSQIVADSSDQQTCGIEILKPDLFQVSFMPEEEAEYYVSLYFNGAQVCPPLKFTCRHACIVDIQANPIHSSSGSSFKVSSNYPLENIEVSVLSPTEERVNIKLQGSSKSTYIYFPTEPGKYTLNAALTGYQTHSIKCFHPDPRCAKECSIVDWPPSSEPKICTPCTLTVNCSKAGEGSLTAKLKVPSDSIKRAVSTSEDGNDNYRISFLPDEVGEHFLYIYWNSVSIYGEEEEQPLSVTVCDPSQCCVQGYGIKQVVQGTRASFRVLTAGSGEGRPQTQPLSVETCYNDGTESRNLHTTVKRKDTTIYKCKYDVPSSSSSSSSITSSSVVINVQWNGHHIPGSPFRARVLAPSPATQCFIREHPVSHLIINQPITVILDAKDVDDGVFNKQSKFDITVHHVEKKESQDVSIFSLEEENVFSVKFTPPYEGYYCMDVLYGGHVIPESGIDFDVLPPPFKHDLLPLYTQYDHVSFSVQLSDSVYSDSYSLEPLSVSIDNAKGIIMHSAVEGNSYQVTFTPLLAGPLEVELNHNELDYTETLSTSVAVLPLTSLTCCEVSHDRTRCLAKLALHAPGRTLEGFKTKSPSINSQTSYTGDKDGEFHPCTAVGVATQQLLYPEIEQDEDGKFLIMTTTTTPDEYDFVIAYYGTDLSCCPFRVDMTMVTLPDKVISYDPVIPFKTGKPIELVLDTSEAGQTSTSDFSITIDSSMARAIPVTVDVMEESKDLFRASFIPPCYGTYLAHVKRGNIPIQGSPITIPFLQERKALVTVGYQPHLGSRNAVTASLYKKGDSVSDISEEEGAYPVAADQKSEDDNSESNAMQEACMPTTAIQQYERGRHQISLFGSQQGVFLLHVYCLGIEIKGSPFTIDTTQPPIAGPLPPQAALVRASVPGSLPPETSLVSRSVPGPHPPEGAPVSASVSAPLLPQAIPVSTLVHGSEAYPVGALVPDPLPPQATPVSVSIPGLLPPQVAPVSTSVSGPLPPQAILVSMPVPGSLPPQDVPVSMSVPHPLPPQSATVNTSVPDSIPPQATPVSVLLPGPLPPQGTPVSTSLPGTLPPQAVPVNASVPGPLLPQAASVTASVSAPLPQQKTSVSVSVPGTEFRSFGILSASVEGKKTGPAPITKFYVNPEEQLASIEFQRTSKQAYDMMLYWNHVPLCGAPFTLDTESNNTGKNA